MIFETVVSGGCRSYVVGCEGTCAAALIDPELLVCCEFGRVSTLATATLRQMGFQRAVALDGGMKAWREAGHAVTTGIIP
jgi:rhodanese-related sulfurtransferase